MSEAATEWLPEISEADAEGRIREIYAEIRTGCSVPMVALIFRHLATVPGALEWSWELLRARIFSGEIPALASRLSPHATVAADEIPREALRVSGLSRQDETGIVAVLDAYNRANPINILVVRCLAEILRAMPTRDAPRLEVSWDPSPSFSIVSLPAMIHPRDMAPTVRDAVSLLTHRVPAGASSLWPSLYRHLANWPPMLGYAAVLVTSKWSEIDAAASAVLGAVDPMARSLARAAPERPLPASSEARAGMLAAIDAFSARIPEMIVIGHLLRNALPRSATNTTAMKEREDGRRRRD